MASPDNDKPTSKDNDDRLPHKYWFLTLGLGPPPATTARFLQMASDRKAAYRREKAKKEAKKVFAAEQKKRKVEFEERWAKKKGKEALDELRRVYGPGRKKGGKKEGEEEGEGEGEGEAAATGDAAESNDDNNTDVSREAGNAVEPDGTDSHSIESLETTPLPNTDNTNTHGIGDGADKIIEEGGECERADELVSGNGGGEGGVAVDDDDDDNPAEEEELARGDERDADAHTEADGNNDGNGDGDEGISKSSNDDARDEAQGTTETGPAAAGSKAVDENHAGDDGDSSSGDHSNDNDTGADLQAHDIDNNHGAAPQRSINLTGGPIVELQQPPNSVADDDADLGDKDNNTNDTDDEPAIEPEPPGSDDNDDEHTAAVDESKAVKENHNNNGRVSSQVEIDKNATATSNQENLEEEDGKNKTIPIFPGEVISSDNSPVVAVQETEEESGGPDDNNKPEEEEKEEETPPASGGADEKSTGISCPGVEEERQGRRNDEIEIEIAEVLQAEAAEDDDIDETSKGEGDAGTSVVEEDEPPATAGNNDPDPDAVQNHVDNANAIGSEGNQEEVSDEHSLEDMAASNQDKNSSDGNNNVADDRNLGGLGEAACSSTTEKNANNAIAEGDIGDQHRPEGALRNDNEGDNSTDTIDKTNATLAGNPTGSDEDPDTSTASDTIEKTTPADSIPTGDENIDTSTAAAAAGGNSASNDSISAEVAKDSEQAGEAKRDVENNGNDAEKDDGEGDGSDKEAKST
ncbi:hypothetical protein F5Y17DRAFT_478491 [Xylariaceae sp. FL0594]|nr:hypothetical protein F5Y17DRAFT_478491 [Xylariaceae sp. FL0594]